MSISKNCTPCSEGTPKLQGSDLEKRASSLRNWSLHREGEDHLEREFKFKDFREALRFTDKVGELAEKENHHPDIFLSWGKVVLTLWTHKIGGLSENDFILAEKINALNPA